MTWRERLARWVGGAELAAVTPVAVGRKDDGLVMRPSGTLIDKPWGELWQEVEDAREAWRKNPLARRLIGLITSYTVGNGITLHSEKRELQKFIDEFWAHNHMAMRVDEWSDELARSGELFPVLFTNTVSGMSKVRVVSASRIRGVEFDPEDYERELGYLEVTDPGMPPKMWTGVGSAEAMDRETPLMLHYAVNRPTGAVRGESDLAAVLPWLRRYNRWLEDRVRLNAAMRAFLWIVRVPARLRSQLEERYRTPPEAGSVIIAEEGAETWEAVTPRIGANDVAADGRAIRWMIVAGGPGTSLLDLGEGEDSNLATGQTMAEQRRRFLRRRQAYLVWLLTDLTFRAYERWRVGVRNRQNAMMSDIGAVVPDISPEDNEALATAAASLTGSLEGMARLVGAGETYKGMALRMFAKFAGETLGDGDVQKILKEGEAAKQEAQRQMEQEQDEQEQEGDDDEREAE